MSNSVDRRAICRGIGDDDSFCAFSSDTDRTRFLPMSPETTEWTLEQAQLRHSAEERIFLAELSEMIPNDLRIALLLDLLRVFGNAVAIALAEINL
ncbi:hypothetical protein [uncultured Roseobacter sp.]|uniref:hypothetical protein n=1 Tax=uncultured Roseobacter sp. TaxID=114847 RepID=UPI00262C91FF|nr:hypothetical protein [uncultured Roseobacter sp.]